MLYPVWYVGLRLFFSSFSVANLSLPFTYLFVGGRAKGLASVSWIDGVDR